MEERFIVAHGVGSVHPGGEGVAQKLNIRRRKHLAVIAHNTMNQKATEVQ